MGTTGTAAVAKSCNSKNQKVTDSWRLLWMARSHSTVLAGNGPDVRTQHLSESLTRRSLLEEEEEEEEEEEVTLASAIGRSKANKRNGGSRSGWLYP